MKKKVIEVAVKVIVAALTAFLTARPRAAWASGPSRKKAGIHTDASLLSFFLSAVVILAFLSRFCSHRDSRGR